MSAHTPGTDTPSEGIDAEFARLVADLDSSLGSTDSPDLDTPEMTGDKVEKGHSVALVLTPVASAQALAGLCAMSGLEIEVIPSTTGALVYLKLDEESQEWELDALLGGSAHLPEKAVELASQLSVIARMPVVLAISWIAPGNEIEPGVTGRVSAHRFHQGKVEDELPPGMLMARMDGVVEDLLLGRVTPQDVQGMASSAQVPRWQALRMLSKGLRRSKDT